MGVWVNSVLTRNGYIQCYISLFKEIILQQCNAFQTEIHDSLRDGPFEFLGGGGGGGAGLFLVRPSFFFFCPKNRIFFFDRLKDRIFFFVQSESRFFFYITLPYESSSMVNTYMHFKLQFH